MRGLEPENLQQRGPHVPRPADQSGMDQSRTCRAALWSLAVVGMLLTACGGEGGETSDRTASEPPPRETVTPCRNVENVFERIVCFADRAEEAGVVEPCDRAANEGVRYQCYAVYAERAADVNVCRSIPAETQDEKDLRDACVSDVAKVTGQGELCDEIEAPGLRDSCYLGVFRETGDVSLCDQIEDPVLASACTGEPDNVE